MQNSITKISFKSLFPDNIKEVLITVLKKFKLSYITNNKCFIVPA